MVENTCTLLQRDSAAMMHEANPLLLFDQLVQHPGS